MSTFLIDSYNPESLEFTKPKKYGDYLVSKIKYPESENKKVLVQFPKMTVTSDQSSKSIELEFTNIDRGYNKKVYNWLSKVDHCILEHVHTKSEEWFGKKIPVEALNTMYNTFIKSPKTTDNNCTINLNFAKGESLLNGKNEPIERSEITKGSTLECIGQLKYIVFSKDTSFMSWDLHCAKLHKKISRVPKFGFVEDPIDQTVDSDEELEIHTFF